MTISKTLGYHLLFIYVVALALDGMISIVFGITELAPSFYMGSGLLFGWLYRHWQDYRNQGSIHA